MTIFKKKLFLSICLLICITSNSVMAQPEKVVLSTGDYIFKTKYDTTEYKTTLNVYNDNDLVFEADYIQSIFEIKEYDLDNDGEEEILYSVYSGGAHCCLTLFAGNLSEGKFILTDSLFLRNGFYETKDLDSNGKLELVCPSDMFAYAFTNYAETRFPTMIYKYEKGKLIEVTSDYKSVVRKQLDEFLSQLKELTGKGFKCEEEGEDTFNTESGSVKNILAAIVADYYSLGEVEKGYELVDSVYKCPDRVTFKLILLNDFKLK